jgi:hypothetical protein
MVTTKKKPLVDIHKIEWESKQGMSLWKIKSQRQTTRVEKKNLREQNSQKAMKKVGLVSTKLMKISNKT